MRIILYILLISLSCSFSFSQKITPKFTYNVELGLPIALANEPFNAVMQGLVGVSTYVQYTTPFHLNVGVGGKYSLFTINEFKVPVALNGSVHSASGFLKIGYDKFLTERFAIDFGVKIGYSYNFSAVKELDFDNKVIARYNNQNDAILVEPNLSLILSADERSSYRFYLGYNIHGYGFKPSFIGLQSSSGWDPNGFDKLTQYLIVGFGYTYYFKNNKQ